MKKSTAVQCDRRSVPSKDKNKGRFVEVDVSFFQNKFNKRSVPLILAVTRDPSAFPFLNKIFMTLSRFELSYIVVIFPPSIWLKKFICIMVSFYNSLACLQPSSGKEKDSDSTKTGSEKGITLLEQIIRSHPIWYLQHIGRSAATHLLRPMNEGVRLMQNSRCLLQAEVIS